MSHRRGFTLLELMIVMAIMVIVASLAVPSIFQSMDGQTRVNAAADYVRAQWAECRTYAIEEGRPYRFAVMPNSGKFKIEPYTGPLQNVDMLNPDPNAAPNMPGGAAAANAAGHVIEDRLPSPVRFGTKESPADPNSMEMDSGEYVTVAIFLPNGTATEDAEMSFGAKGSSLVTIRLRAITGSSIEVPRENGK
jgi:prepilin-type N-terminal cleavage/methylation domain-containing protein